MDTSKKEILQSAEKILQYTNLLINQCDSWLSAEEGNRATVEKILRKRKEKKKNRFNNLCRLLINVLLSTVSLSALPVDNEAPDFDVYQGRFTTIDSLFYKYERVAGTARVDVVNLLINALAEQQIVLPRQYKHTDNLVVIDAFIYGAIGRYEMTKDRFIEAIGPFEKSITLSFEVNDSLRACKRIQKLYTCYVMTGDFDRALQCLQLSLDTKNMAQHYM